MYLSQFCRFCDAMIQIRKEAEDVVTGKQPKDNNLLTNAPHTMAVIASDEWNRSVLLIVVVTLSNCVMPGLILAKLRRIPCHGLKRRSFGQRCPALMTVRAYQICIKLSTESCFFQLTEI